jgi:hypothetical protein
MNKKTGIILASVIGVLVLCCGGVFYLTRTTLERVKETVQQNRNFVATTLEKTGKSWDESVFAEVADSAFLTPEGRDGTKKRKQRRQQVAQRRNGAQDGADSAGPSQTREKDDGGAGAPARRWASAGNTPIARRFTTNRV